MKTQPFNTGDKVKYVSPHYNESKWSYNYAACSGCIIGDVYTVAHYREFSDSITLIDPPNCIMYRIPISHFEKVTDTVDSQDELNGPDYEDGPEFAGWEDRAFDAVQRPKHYASHPSGVECIQITEHMTFNCGNVVKYIWRNGLKDSNPSVQDLEKAKWYIQRELSRISESSDREIDRLTKEETKEETKENV